MDVKAKAQAMATALATIGKFVIRKKVGAPHGMRPSQLRCRAASQLDRAPADPKPAWSAARSETRHPKPL